MPCSRYQTLFQLRNSFPRSPVACFVPAISLPVAWVSHVHVACLTLSEARPLRKRQAPSAGCVSLTAFEPGEFRGCQQRRRQHAESSVAHSCYPIFHYSLTFSEQY